MQNKQKTNIYFALTLADNAQFLPARSVFKNDFTLGYSVK